ncbi:cilia- and flagella-associated protein 20-like [Argiope bruennichi]|uniref:Cilia- and flagella-associated protein 20 like protein n=1 Tax=Argiope bruennichi TaxID=94029 RepID=A0A8T0E6D9_ARGBR|nr:cilia- and flagella-associated protein 20-like [Argiope bruennichi]KAF8766947.1 Cilia- and flagella-associated protein 20 like protein [Argiope bruennichi]
MATDLNVFITFHQLIKWSNIEAHPFGPFMFRNKLQSGIISLLCGSGLDPLKLWGVHGKGCIKRITDKDVQTLAIEITAAQFCTTCISLPRDKKNVIGIRLPYLTLNIKYLKLPFCFEFEVLDSRMTKRRFRLSNAQSGETRKTLLCHIPLALEEGWNNIQIDLFHFTRMAYGTDFVELQRLEIYANCRIRRIFISDRWYKEEELPKDYIMKKPTKLTRSILRKD